MNATSQNLTKQDSKARIHIGPFQFYPEPDKTLIQSVQRVTSNHPELVKSLKDFDLQLPGLSPVDAMAWMNSCRMNIIGQVSAAINDAALLIGNTGAPGHVIDPDLLATFTEWPLKYEGRWVLTPGFVVSVAMREPLFFAVSKPEGSPLTLWTVQPTTGRLDGVFLELESGLDDQVLVLSAPLRSMVETALKLNMHRIRNPRSVIPPTKKKNCLSPWVHITKPWSIGGS